jgi:undecaprenyl diphosphate synthase
MNYPKHVALIPDWNRTRAKAHDKSVAEAYMTSYEKAVEIIEYTFTKTDAKIITLWWLSTENSTKRPKEEYDFLMNMHKLVDEYLDNFLIANKINFKVIWDLNGITDEFRQYLLDKEKKTRCDTDKYFVFAINYWGRDEIIRGIKRLNTRNIDFATITEDELSKALDLWELPTIELVIRTKWDQAQRTSGFMSRWIWYAELYFTEHRCPEFGVEEYKQALSRFDKMSDLRNYWK